MRHRVGRHQNFKTVESGYQVIFDVLAPDALLALKLLVNMLDDLGQEGTGPGSRIQYLYFMNFLVRPAVSGFRTLIGKLGIELYRGFAGIGQSLRQIELGFQKVIYRAHDKIDYRLGRIPDAAAFPEFRVVFGQKGFVKMDNRIVPAGGLAEIVEQGGATSVARKISASESTIQVIRSSRS